MVVARELIRRLTRIGHRSEVRERTAALSLPMVTCKPIRTDYFLRVPNVGDLVGPALITRLTARQTVYNARADEPYLVGMGSRMARASEHARIWGTGVMHPRLGLGAARVENIWALRGKLTHSLLAADGRAVGDVPLGDPGVIVPELFGIEKAEKASHRLGVVAHYHDRADPRVAKLLAADGVCDLDVQLDFTEFLTRMARCDAVVSSSLHGLIFAEAMGIPNLWIEVTDRVAGDGFKFRDWFSTMGVQQESAVRLGDHHTVDELIARSTPHDSQIDSSALIGSLVGAPIEDLQEPTDRVLVPLEACRRAPTPVFVISFNRGRALQQTVAGLNAQASEVDIVVHDNGSTDPTTMAVLDRLEHSGHRVVRAKAIHSPAELDGVDATIQEYFASWAEPQPYLVTDCDIDLSEADSASLEVYEELLARNPGVECVGPMLTIRDVPRDYVLRARVLNQHVDMFWRREPHWAETSRGAVAVLKAKVRTSLAIHRAGESFRSPKSGFRVYWPFEARHLEWYPESVKESAFLETSSPRISHWSNNVRIARHQAEELTVERLNAVRRGVDGRLEVYVEFLR